MSTETKTEDTRTHAELEEAVREGDTAITAEQLAVARERDRLAELEAEAAVRAEQQAEATAHQTAVDRLRADIDGMPGNASQLQELADKATEALSALIAALQERELAVRALAMRAAQLGITEMRYDGQVRSSSGLGWRRSGGSTILIKDGRRLTVQTPHRLLTRVVHDARTARGLSEREPGAVSNFMPPPVSELIDALDQAPVPPEPKNTPAVWLSGNSMGQVEMMTWRKADHLLKRRQVRLARGVTAIGSGRYIETPPPAAS